MNQTKINIDYCGSRGFVPHGKLPLFITPLLWFCYAVEARF
ncbi:hypothetical protein [Anaerotruncus rubiinfantis]|nr:hypothetical protein [Anaerotruncus rubiinfantis]